MELCDLYTENRVKTGETHIRGNAMPKDRYHLVVNVWIKNASDKYLISQRAETRSVAPLKYECVRGSVLKDESSIEGAIREVKEEVGIDLTPEMGNLIYSEVHIINCRSYIVDAWLFGYNGEIDLKNTTTDEVRDARWMTVNEIYELHSKGLMVFNSTEAFDRIVSYTKEEK